MWVSLILESWKYVRPIKSRVMPSWICSSWFYFEGSSNLEVVGFAASEKTRKTGWFQGQHTKTWPSSLRSSVDHGFFFKGTRNRVTCWNHVGFQGFFPVTSRGPRMRHVVLVYLQWQVMGLAALWRNGARCAENRFTWTGPGLDHWLRWLFGKKHPNSCRSEWPMFGRK